MTMGRGGIFGNPRVGMEDYDLPMMTQMPQGEMQAMRDSYGSAPKKPGFLDKGGSGLNILGILGDALVGSRGGPMVFTHNLIQQRQAARDAMAAEQQRQQDWEDFTRQYDYKRQNPMPSTSAPYRWESNDGDVYELGPDGQPRRVFDDPTPKMNFIPDGLGGGQWVSVPNAGPSNAPARPVGKLTPIAGDGSGNAAGNFQR